MFFDDPKHSDETVRIIREFLSDADGNRTRGPRASRDMQ
jgi:hypothetical protein